MTPHGPGCPVITEETKGFTSRDSKRFAPNSGLTTQMASHMPAYTGMGQRPPAILLHWDVLEKLLVTRYSFISLPARLSCVLPAVSSIQGTPMCSPHCRYPAPLFLKSVHHTVNMSSHQGPEMQPRQFPGCSPSQVPDYTLLAPYCRGESSAWETEKWRQSSDIHPLTGWVTGQGISPRFRPSFCFPGGRNRAGILDWVAIFSLRGSSQPRDQTRIS